MKVSDCIRNIIKDVSLAKNNLYIFLDVVENYLQLIAYILNTQITNREKDILVNLSKCLEYFLREKVSYIIDFFMFT